MHLVINYNEQSITVFYKKENVGAIRWNINPYHNRNYYLDMDFVLSDVMENGHSKRNNTTSHSA